MLLFIMSETNPRIFPEQFAEVVPLENGGMLKL